MNRLSAALLVSIGVSAAGIATDARADNPLGAYVGVGVGQSNVGNNDNYDYGYYGGYHDHDATWKVMAGIRPLPIVGAEVEYIDFGKGAGDSGYYGNNNYYSNESSHPKATVLYGLGYLPLPLPFLDVFGKLGVARLQTNIDTYTYAGTCAQPTGGATCAPASYRTDQTDTRIAYGAGLQAKWQDFAFRAEYERISSQFGDPAAFTVSATWTF
ncbi:MAG TPA: outer membrane beta-barrel protein [Steroidobacteraceae bacterium]|jgi:hypothetical protein|nr:outer membrane beta-barrel protein [Steroidobacteraceae bacterium]